MAENIQHNIANGNESEQTQGSNITAQNFPVLSQVTVQSVDRTPKTVAKWRSGHVTAESVYYPDVSPLFDLYNDLELDAFVAGEFEKRDLFTLNKRLRYKKGGKPVEDMDNVISSLAFRDLRLELLKIKRWGRGGFEFPVGKEFGWEEIPKKHIKPKWGIISTEQNGDSGYKYAEIDNVWVIDRRNLGKYLICGFYILLKKGVISDWAEYIEVFGLPTEVLEYEANDPQTKAELNKIINNRGSALKLLLPKTAGYRQESVDGSNGNGDLQDKFRKACNEELSVYILGSTETSTSSDGSGYAQSKTHSDQQAEIIKADMDEHLNFLNDPKFLAILQSYGFPVVEGAKFEFDAEVDIKFLSEKIKIDKTLATDMKLPMSKKYLYDTYNVTAPENEADTLRIIEEALDTGEEDSPVPGQKPKSGMIRTKPKAVQLSAWQKFLDFFG